MKKIGFFISLLLLSFTVSTASVHAGTYSQETNTYKMTIVTTDTGVFLVVNPKKTFETSPIIMDRAYTNHNDPAMQQAKVVFDSAAVLTIKADVIFWLGGLSPATAYYFYPYPPVDMERAGLKLTPIRFTTDAVSTVSGPYKVTLAPGTVFSNGSLPFIIKVPTTETRKLSVTTIPRGSLGAIGTAIDLTSYPTVDLGVVSGGEGKGVATGLQQGRSYVFVMHPTGDTTGTILTASRIETGPLQSVTAKTLDFKSSSGTMQVSGQIDTTTNDAPEDLCITLDYIDAQTGSFENNQTPEGYRTETARVKPEATADYGVNHDGTYYWIISNINPGNYYSFRELFHLRGTNGQCNSAVIGTPVIGKFNSDKGILIAGSPEANNDYESHSYRLLAPLPGLSVLLDPSLCREQKIANGDHGQICDINDFLNYVFKLMVGVAAVILVIRIMIEGFKYATSDVITIKISSKEKLWQGIWGLLLALSAWLILNTINPKLVQNDIVLPSVELNIDEVTYIPPDVFQKITGRKITPKKDLLAIVNQVSTDKNFDSCIVQTVIQMESPDWNEGAVGCDENHLGGGSAARRAFIASGITLMGNPLPSGSTVDSPVKNDNFTPEKGHSACYFNKDKSGYNLDWRFSKGFGLSQKTYNPKDEGGYTEQQYLAATKKGGKLWDARSTVPAKISDYIRTPQEQIQDIVSIFSSKQRNCGSDLQCAFTAYNGGGPAAKQYGAIAMATYNRCKANGGL